MLPGIAIFGTGPLVHMLVRYFRANNFRIEALWSPTHEQAQSLATEHQIPVASSVIDKILLLPTVQLIVIATAPHFHVQIASKACGIGKHVLCNWPPAYSMAEMASMRAAASNYPSLITLVFTALRFIPAFEMMRKLILTDQLIGPVKAISGSVLCDVFSIYEEKSITWDKFMGGGLLSLFGINMIDIITYTTGLRARKVHGTVRTFNQMSNNHIVRNNADDFVTFQMEMFDPQRDLVNGGGVLDAAGKSRQMVVSDGGSKSTNQPVIGSVTLNGLQYSQLPGHELIVYGGNGYLSYRNGNLYGKLLKQPSQLQQQQSQQGGGRGSPTTENGHSSFSSGHDSLHSIKENIFFLDDMDSFIHDFASRRSSLSSNLVCPGSIRSHVWPEIYQRGIFHLIGALKSAFFGGDQANNGADESTTVHSMACAPIEVDTTSSTPSNASSLLDEIHWIKEPVKNAVNFDEGLYIQTVIEAIKQSSEEQRWVRVNYVPL